MKRRIVTILAVGAAAALALAGCAPATTTAHTSGPSATAKPAREAASTPGSRVPLTCADLYAPADVQALVGAPVTVTLDGATAIGDLQAAAGKQLGVLGCEWSGTDGVEEGPLADLTIYIAPDSAAAFAQYSSDDKGPNNAATPVTAPAGDKASYWCDADGRGGDTPLCGAEMLEGSYWVTTQLEAINPATAATTGANMVKVLNAVASKLKAAGEPATTEWKSPEAAPPGFCTDPGSTAKLAAAVGVSGLVLSPLAALDINASGAGLPGRVAACSWSNARYGSVGVELLAGGSWIFSNFAPVESGDSTDDAKYVTASIPGTTAALLSCGGGGCDAFMAVGPTAVEINIQDVGTAKDTAILAAVAKDIAAS